MPLFDSPIFPPEPKVRSRVSRDLREQFPGKDGVANAEKAFGISVDSYICGPSSTTTANPVSTSPDTPSLRQRGKKLTGSHCQRLQQHQEVQHQPPQTLKLRQQRSHSCQVFLLLPVWNCTCINHQRLWMAL